MTNQRRGRRAALPLLFPILASAALSSGALASCSGEEPDPPRLVVLYAACSLNKDFLQPYNPEIAFTPGFEAFGKESLVFTRHNTEAGQSGIAFASIFTGTQANRHKAYRHPVQLSERLYQVTELFRDAGYETFFWSGQQMGSWRLRYGQGVPPRNYYHRTSDDDTDRYTANDDEFRAILAKLKSDPEYKAFVQINLTLSHSPYHLYATGEVLEEFLRKHPEAYPQGLTDEEVNRIVNVYAEWRLPLQWDYEDSIRTLVEDDVRFEEEDVPKLHAILEMLYKACVWRLDKYFGRFVRSIDDAGLKEDSAICFTADHGEILYRENAIFQWTHGLQLAPEVLHVPWMIRAPRACFEPGRFEAVTRSIDVYPTLGGLCGLTIPPQAPVDGVDLSAALCDEEPVPELLAYSHTTTIGPSLLELFEGWTSKDLNPRDDVNLVWVRIRDEDVVYKWRNLGAEAWGFEVFDLANDPGETTNLYDEADPTHRRMADKLRAYKQLLVTNHTLLARPPGGVEDEEARLRALGYIGDVPEEPEEPEKAGEAEEQRGEEAADGGGE